MTDAVVSSPFPTQRGIWNDLQNAPSAEMKMSLDLYSDRPQHFPRWEALGARLGVGQHQEQR